MENYSHQRQFWKMRVFWLITKGSLMVRGSELCPQLPSWSPSEGRKLRVWVISSQDLQSKWFTWAVPFLLQVASPALRNHMDPTGPIGEGAPCYPREGLPCPSDSSELVSSALGPCLMPIQGCQEQDWLTAMPPLWVCQAFHI